MTTIDASVDPALATEEASARPPEASVAARFRALFDAECSNMFHTLRRLGVMANDLDDLAQEVFVTAFHNLESYDSSRPIRPWLFGIAVRTVANYRRLARHRREVLDDSELRKIRDSGPSVEEKLGSEHDCQLVLDALDALDLDRRAVLVMHDLEGYTVPEIAAALSTPLNTVYSRLRLAREQFATVARRLKSQRGDL